MDAERRETSLVMGVGILLALVAVVFFSMTMAWRQMAQRQARWRELRAQVAQAQHRAGQAPAQPARERLAARAQAAVRLFVTPDQVPTVRDRLSALATEVGATLAWLPATTPAAPSAAVPGFEACYQVQSLVGTVEAPYRELAEFLARVAALEQPAVGVRSGTVTPSPAGGRGGLLSARPRLRARVVLETYLWIPGALPKGPAPAVPPGLEPASGHRAALGEGGPAAAWGRDPFDPRYAPTPGVEGVTLNGILWDPAHPTCLLNGAVSAIGSVVNGYTVIAITPEVVVLRGESREAVLAVSP